MARGPGNRDAATLRAEFDAAFGARAEMPPEGVSLLAIRIGAEPFAVRVLDTGGLIPLPVLVPVPSRRPEVVGVAGLRGEIVPVYGLARMVLGVQDAPPRWMILTGAAERIGFGFSAFEGHLVADRASLRPTAGAELVARHVRELYTGTPSRPVLDLASLYAAATARTDRESP
jgi:purine-binding chemotaxis protein CheW